MVKATCCPEKRHHAKGLCKSCYDRPRAYKSFLNYHNKQATDPSYRLNRNARDRTIHSYRQVTDPNYRLKRSIRNRTNKALHGNSRAGSAVRDLGCSIPHFKLYIENQFEPGMTWDNYGEWHLDHVMPLSKFDLTDRQQFLEACNWLNYQPLWAEDNLQKSNKMSPA